ncbi:MAG TPA: glycoside hydrolase family 43 protein [Jatrophihabitans sp.]|nr:glycoside hydrolase family 43 protein [Jatrophihabitans sp.]
MSRGRLAAALAAALVFGGGALAGCGSAASPSHPASTPGAASTPARAGTYVNPVWDRDFPDPAVLRAGNTFHAYGTQGGGANVQTLTSTDLVHWRAGADALPQVGRWATAGDTWAPEVIATGGRYVMYYVAHANTAGKQCIGRATAGDPAGPFTDPVAAPLVCQAALGGSIDPDPFRAPDGSLYLYWKNDGNCCGKAVHLWGQQLSADGSRLLGRPVALMTNDRPWQGNLVEAPEMLAHAGGYVLFYSANDYASPLYGIGWASCRGPLGPCTDRSSRSLVASNDVAAGPGHCFPLVLPGGTVELLYHAWPPDAVGSQSPGRLLWMEPLTWRGDVPVVHPSEASPQPAPAL